MLGWRWRWVLRKRPQELDLTALSQAQYLYIEGYLATSTSARHAVSSARALAQAQGIKTALTFSDPAMVQYARTGLVEMLAEGVDILFCNEHEALLWANTDNLNQAITVLHELSPLVIVTCGSKGALISEKSQQTTIAPFPVTIWKFPKAAIIVVPSALFRQCVVI